MWVQDGNSIFLCGLFCRRQLINYMVFTDAFLVTYNALTMRFSCKWELTWRKEENAERYAYTLNASKIKLYELTKAQQQDNFLQ